MNIFIINSEDTDRREVLEFLREECGYHVSAINELPRANNSHNEHSVNIVLIEFHFLISLTGLPERLREYRNGNSLHVVVLSGTEDPKPTENRLRELGFDQYITTDDVTMLPEMIEGRLGSESAGKQPERAEAPLRVIEAPSKGREVAVSAAPPENRGKLFYREIEGIGRVGIFSEHIRSIVSVAEQLHLNRSLSVLIEGETGTGKEIMARIVHHGSGEDGLPFVSLNCSAISPTLFESELFGYEGGAFTGSKKHGMIGKLELAKGGTIYLDEIGDMPLEMQPKLLRALEEKEIYRVGGIAKIPLNVRVICSTNRSLRTLVEAGKFRSDLYFRLNAGRLLLKPLRESPEAILPLAQMFLEIFSSQKKRSFRVISREAASMLEAYQWPGNVRELRNTIECAVLFYDDVELSADYLKIALAESEDNALSAGMPIKPGSIILPPDKLDIYALESEIIRKTLIRFKGNKSRAATFLGVSRSTLRSWIKRLLPKYSG